MKKIDEGEYTTDQLAAGLLKLCMGKDPENIDFNALKKERKQRRSSDRGQRREGSRDSRDFKGRRSKDSGDRYGRHSDRFGLGKSRDKDGKKGSFLADAVRGKHKKASGDKFRRNVRPKTEKLGASRREN